MHRKTSHKKHWWGSLWAPASSNLSMFCLFVGSKCLRGSKLLITSIARKIQVILSAVSFKHSCIFKWLVAMYAMKHDGILAVHCVLVFSQTFICYKCLVTLVRSHMLSLSALEMAPGISPQKLMFTLGWLLFLWTSSLFLMKKFLGH